MKKRFLILPILLVVILAGFLLHRSAAMANRQNYIFCQLLLPGMNKYEVLYILEQFGNIEYNISTFGNDNFEIYMGYVDPLIVGRKTFILTFRNGGYTGVSALTGFWKGIDNVDAVCEP